jgi:hypothetical protein
VNSGCSLHRLSRTAASRSLSLEFIPVSSPHQHHATSTSLDRTPIARIPSAFLNLHLHQIRTRLLPALQLVRLRRLRIKPRTYSQSRSTVGASWTMRNLAALRLHHLGATELEMGRCTGMCMIRCRRPQQQRGPPQLRSLGAGCRASGATMTSAQTPTVPATAALLRV